MPFIFLSKGEEVWFCDKDQDAPFHKVETVFTQDDILRRQATRGIRRNPLDIPIDSRRPFPSAPMRRWPISIRVNKPENDDPSILEQVELAIAAA